MMIPKHLIQTVAALRPQRVTQAFRAEFATRGFTEEMLADSGSGNRRADLTELRSLPIE